jgi:chemotaxis protein histidine kinase CheA
MGDGRVALIVDPSKLIEFDVKAQFALQETH